MRSRFAAVLALGVAACVQGATETERVGTVEYALTVDQAVSSGCSTKSVEALTKQIIAQANCIAKGAFVEVPKRPNVTFGSAVVPYMEQPARDALLEVLDANKGTTMTINSMLRSVAQQYLLYRWYQAGKCGIGLAAKPGSSNHETGLAIDVQEYATWRPKLEAKKLSWFGSKDPVHFDYEGPGAVDQSKVGVLAFQKLWNKNNPNDLLTEDGVYGPKTEARLKSSPAEGFPMAVDDCSNDGGAGGNGTGAGGAGAGGGSADDDVTLEARFVDAEDVFSDGPSQGVVDLVVGRRYQLEVTASGEKGAVDALEVEVTLPAGLEAAGATITTVKLEAEGSSDVARGTLSVDATGYTVTTVAPAEIRLATGNAKGALKADVYSDRRWEFDGERLEGWTSAQKLAVTSVSEVGEAGSDGELVLSGAVANLVATSPSISLATAGLGGLTVRARRSGDAQGAAMLYLDAASFELDLPADGELHDVYLSESLLPPTIGTIRFVPFEGGQAPSVTASIAQIRPGEARGVVEDDDGCGCRVGVGASKDRPGEALPHRRATVLLVVGCGLALFGRRRLAKRTLRGSSLVSRASE